MQVKVKANYLAWMEVEDLNLGTNENKFNGSGHNFMLKEDVMLWRIYGIQQCSGHGTCINAILNETRIWS